MTQAASQDLRVRAAKRDTRQKTKHPGITYRETLRGRTYYVSWGGKYMKAGATQQEALNLQASLRERKSRGERVVVASKRTVREVADEWYETEKGRWKADYAAAMRRCLDVEILDEFGDNRVSSLGPREIVEYDRKLRKRGLSESGAANIQKPLRGLLDHAVLCGDISVSPYRQVPRGKLSSCNTKRRHHEWTTEQVDKFIATAYAFDERKDAKRSYGLQVEVMVRLGLRIAEVSGLRFSDIDHEAKEIRVRRQFSLRGEVHEYTKTAAGRRDVPVTDQLLARINFRQSFLGLGDDDFVFAEVPGGNPPTHSNFRRRAWNRIVEKTAITLDEGVKITPHSARHATASQLADLDLDSDDVAKLLGHSSAKVTEGIYVHSFDADKRQERIRKAMERAMSGDGSH